MPENEVSFILVQGRLWGTIKEFLYCFQSNQNFSFVKINLAGSLRFDWRFLDTFLLRLCSVLDYIIKKLILLPVRNRVFAVL